MKKYVKPTSDVVKIESTNVLCASGETDKEKVNNETGYGTYL